jgi:TPR repeat protein
MHACHSASLGEGAVQTIEPEMMSHDRGDARAAILNAARAIVEREGIENLTLGKVASEASLPRPVVFGQFVRKEDLLLCVIADSLATLARKMGGIENTTDESTTDATRDGAVILTLSRADDTANLQEAMVDVAREASAAMGGSAGTAGSTAERRQSRRIDMTRLTEPHNRAAPSDDVTVVDDKTEGAYSHTADAAAAPRAPDAWLERRLRVFERAMTAMQARQEQVEKDSRAVVVSAENSIKAMEGTLNQLIARVDDSEARQKTAANELRMALSEANLRIQTVEGVARAALVENDAGAFEETPVETLAVEPAPQFNAGETHSEPEVDAEAHAETAHKSFLDSARASAIAAATAKAESEAIKQKPKKHDKSLRYALIGFLVGAAFVAAAGVAFSKGVRDGRSEALRRVLHSSVPSATAVATIATPLDKLTRLAESGDAAAELAIANRYLGDAGTSRDPVAGLHWMTRAAKHGNAMAQYELGSLYQKGVGASADPVQAMHWYEASALQGNRKAMHDLAIAYAEGFGGVKSASEAVRWFSRAAGLGYVDSQFDLAVLYERGDGVPQSLLDAYKWYAIAGAQGDAESKSRIDALRTQLSSDDLAAAQHAADAFRAQPYNPATNTAPKI